MTVKELKSKLSNFDDDLTVMPFNLNKGRGRSIKSVEKVELSLDGDPDDLTKTFVIISFDPRKDS